MLPIQTIFVPYVIRMAQSAHRPLCAQCNIDYAVLRGGGGGGGGVHPDYFVKLDFEIAVDQQTRARDRTFEGVPDSG